MPRYSKKRASTSSPYTGINHHIICVISTLDEYDNLILQIVGLGRCTTNMLKECIESRLNNVKAMTTDSASAYQEFCSNYNIELQAIPSGFHSINF